MLTIPGCVGSAATETPIPEPDPADFADIHRTVDGTWYELRDGAEGRERALARGRWLVVVLHHLDTNGVFVWNRLLAEARQLDSGTRLAVQYTWGEPTDLDWTGNRRDGLFPILILVENGERQRVLAGFLEPDEILEWQRVGWQDPDGERPGE